MFLGLFLRVCLILGATQPSTNVNWTNATDLTLEGRAWIEDATPFARLPARVQPLVRPQLWEMSRHSSGISVGFTTAADELTVRWKLTSDELAMVHMPATGVSGLDLYLRDEKGVWRFVHNFRPAAGETTATTELNHKTGVPREYRLYLPLYNGVDSLALSAPAEIRGLPKDPNRKCVVVYGTSIDQGACASRPGMAWPSIMGRQLDVEVINLGFSGNGRLDPPIAELMAELDPAVFVLSPLWNVNYEDAETITARSLKFIQILRAKRPNTPIVMVGEANFRPEAHPTPATTVFHKVFTDLVAAGDQNLHWLDGRELLGSDGEATVDGIHPSDLGMQRQATVVSEIVRKLVRGRIPGAG